MLLLRLVDSGGAFEFPPDRETITVGRAPGNDILLDNPHVSAFHGQISLCSEGYRFQDLGSTNGSVLEREGRRTVIGGQDAPAALLRAGDRLLLGSESQPAALEVLTCEATGEKMAVAATVVASLPVGRPAELGEKIRARGGELLCYIRLMEELNRAEDQEAAAGALFACLAEQLPRAGEMALLDPHPTGGAPEVLARRGKSERCWSPPEALPGAEVVVATDDSGGCTAWARLEAGAARDLLAAVELAAGSAGEAELEILSLACALCEARLRQLGLVERLERARESLATKNRYLKERAAERASASIIGRSRVIDELRQQIRQVAVSDATVLISGPSGSGKELVAREIHRQSLRHAEIFAAVNCGALVDSLLEGELFGSKKGAYTGAVRDREGLFQVADGGTLFLDEVGEMSPALQVKLLRVLETGEVQAVGANRPRRVDVRVVAATNRDLEAAAAAGAFRQDLFFRINVFPLRVPPLQERREDVPLLAEHFLGQYSARHGVAAERFSAEAMRLLCARDWPGNVRQLANEIQRAVLLAGEEEIIRPEHIARAEEGPLQQAAAAADGVSLHEQMRAYERILVRRALDNCGGNRTRAAEQLGLTRQALLVKLKKLGLE